MESPRDGEAIRQEVNRIRKSISEKNLMDRRLKQEFEKFLRTSEEHKEVIAKLHEVFEAADDKSTFEELFCSVGGEECMQKFHNNEDLDKILKELCVIVYRKWPEEKKKALNDIFSTIYSK